MPAKTVLFGAQARASMLQGIDVLANAVRVTLGPKGRNVLMSQSGSAPKATKDGASLAEDFSVQNPFRNMGVQVLKEAADRASREAGDGTTTAIVLAQAIAHGGMRAVAGGANPMDVRRGIDLATRTAIDALLAAAQPVKDSEEIAQVGTIAANGDAQIGRQLAGAMARIGPNGAILIEPHERMETTTELVEGMQFESGYLSPYFVTDADTMTAKLDDALVFLCDQRLTDLAPMVPLLEQVLEKDASILIIAQSIEGAALASLLVNQLRGNLRVVAVQAPGYGENRKELLEDIAIMTGAQVHCEDSGEGFQNISLATLGFVRQATIGRNETTLIGGQGSLEAIESRVAHIRREIERDGQAVDVETLHVRVAKLTGGIAVMRIGGATEAEVYERHDRVENALAATRAAVTEGVVPGGGVSLFRAAACLAGLHTMNASEEAGVAAVRSALEAPLRLIASNAGQDGAVVAGHVRDAIVPVFGYDAQNDSYGDMFEFGIIDAVKVVRVALSAAASVAGLIITTEAMVGVTPRAVRQPRSK